MWSVDKVQFKCPTCNEKIRIAVENLKDRELIQCPNCQFNYPTELIFHINKSIRHAAEAYVFVKEHPEYSDLEFDFISLPE